MRRTAVAPITILAAVLLVAAPVAAAPVKTKVVIEKVTHTSQAGPDAYTAKGKVKAAEPACRREREVVILDELGPPFDSTSVAQTVQTNRRGRWKAEWTGVTAIGSDEEVTTGVYYAEVEKLERRRIKCSFARSRTYTIPAPSAEAP
jgi:hypothetical protein